MIRQISYRAGLVWVAFVGLFALAFVLRWRVLGGYHPVLQNADEVSRFLNTLLIRHDRPALSEAFGIYTFNPTYDYTGFPPLQLWLHAWLHRWVEMQVAFPVPADYVLAARYLSLAASMLTLVLMLWMGYVLARPLGNGWALLCGWLTGFVWAVTPVIILVTNLGLADPLLYPFIPLAIITMVHAIRRDSPPFAILTLISVILAIYTKYALAYALVFPAVAALGIIVKRGWRGALPWIGAMAVISAMTAGWLIWGNQMFGLENRETQIFFREGLANALSWRWNFVNFIGILNWTTGVPLFFGGIVSGLAAWITSRRRGQSVTEGWILVTLIVYAIVAFPMISSVVVITDPDRARYTIAPMIGLLGLWGLGITQLLYVLSRLLEKQIRLRSLLMIVVFVGFTAPILVPSLARNQTLAQQYREDHIMEQVWQWSEGAIPQPEGRIMIMAGSERWQQFVWDRTNGGYDGSTAFEFIVEPDPTHLSPQEFVESGVSYLFLSEADLQRSPVLADYTSNLLLLRAFDPAPGTATTSYFYRLLRPAHTVDYPFENGIQLSGYDIVNKGDQIMFRPYWQTTDPILENLSMFVHLRPIETPTATVDQFDGPPVSHDRLTPTWDTPGEILIGNPVVLNTPGEVSGYQLWIGLYDPITGVRLPLNTGETSIPIALSR